MQANVLRNQLFESGFKFGLDYITPKKIHAYLHAQNCDLVMHGYFENTTKALSAMLDKIGELGISGKYVTKEMIKE